MRDVPWNLAALLNFKNKDRQLWLKYQSSQQTCSIKKAVLKNFEISTYPTLQLKKRQTQMLSCEYCESFKNILWTSFHTLWSLCRRGSRKLVISRTWTLPLTKMKFFVATIYCWNLLTVIKKSYILDVTGILAYCVKLCVRV